MTDLLKRFKPAMTQDAAAEAVDAGSAAHEHVIHKDYEGAKTGMWIFLFTELLLFGGLFLVYAVYRTMYTHEFHLAAGHLNVTMGVVNTFILLTSSLTMVLSVVAMQKGDKRSALNTLFWTMFLACGFLVNKYFEWGAKIEHDLYPGSETMLSLPHGEILFYGLYYVMTGLHSFHVIVGLVVMAVVWYYIKTDRITQDDFVKLENTGLYWHLVDLIWIFLLPLFYLTN